MSNNNIKYTLIISLLCLILGFVIGMSINKTKIESKIETQWLRDTIEVEIPVPIPTPVEVIKTEYITIPSEQIITQGDSLFIAPIPIESKTYETKDYKAVVEGYKPKLTEMTIYQNTKVETITETKYKTPKLQLGFGAGVSYIPTMPEGMNKFQPSFNISIYVPIKTIF